jgi:hypothetical protein
MDVRQYAGGTERVTRFLSAVNIKRIRSEKRSGYRDTANARCEPLWSCGSVFDSGRAGRTKIKLPKGSRLLLEKLVDFKALS